MLFDVFYENVSKARAEGRTLAEGDEDESIVIKFRPETRADAHGQSLDIRKELHIKRQSGVGVRPPGLPRYVNSGYASPLVLVTPELSRQINGLRGQHQHVKSDGCLRVHR